MKVSLHTLNTFLQHCGKHKLNTSFIFTGNNQHVKIIIGGNVSLEHQEITMKVSCRGAVTDEHLSVGLFVDLLLNLCPTFSVKWCSRKLTVKSSKIQNKKNKQVKQIKKHKVVAKLQHAQWT